MKTDNLTIKAFKYSKLAWHITHLSRDSINGLSTDAQQTIKSTNITTQIVSNLYTVSTPSRLSISSNQQPHKISYKWVKRVFTKSKELIARQDTFYVYWIVWNDILTNLIYFFKLRQENEKYIRSRICQA